MIPVKKRAGQFCMVVAAALMVSACAKPPEGSRSQQVAMEVKKNFGTTHRQDNRAVYSEYDEDGAGFTMFRGYSELPFPDRYTARAPEAYGNTLVVDFALDFKEMNGFPVYRIGVRPRKISLEDVRMLPSYVTVNTVPEEGRPSRLVGKLPMSRSLDRNGFIWTDYTYCSECFELSRIAMAPDRFDEGAFEIYGRGVEAARKPSGRENGFEGFVRFVDFAEEGILWGADIGPITAIAQSEVRTAKAKIDMVMPSREAYFEFVQAYPKEATPVNVMLGTCGEYEPSGDPAATLASEKDRVEGYASCLASVLEDYDVSSRLQRINELRAEEAGLADAGAIKMENRVAIKSLEEERSAAYTLIRETYGRFMNWKSEEKSSEMTIVKAPKADIDLDVETEKKRGKMDVPVEHEGIKAVDQSEKSARENEAIHERSSSSQTRDKLEAAGEPACSIMILCPEKFQ